MLTGLNHITLAVSDVQASFDFYVNLLGFRPRARWARGAYLSLGELWLCVSFDENEQLGEVRSVDMPRTGTMSAGTSSAGVPRSPDYTHVAFTVSAQDLPQMVAALQAAGVTQWKQNTSEGASFYFLDPDGHKLELHAGDLQSRLASIEAHPYDGLELFD